MTLRPDGSPCTIGDVCEFESGNGFRPQDWKTKGLPIIRIQNLNGSNSFNYFDGEPDPAWIVEPSDLLFAWAGVKGVSFGPTIWNGPKGVLNQHIYRIRPKEGVNKRWLYYALLEVTAEIERKAHGFKTSLVHVRKADITRARISLPSEHEQEAVATALGHWDTAIQKTEQLIAAKLRRFRVLRERLVTSPRKNVSALTVGRRETIRFGDIFALSKEVAKTGTSLEVLSVTTGGIVRQSEYFNKQVASEDKSGYLIARRGQLVMSGLNFWMGSIDFQTICDVGIVSPAYKVFSIVGAGLDIDYLRHYVRSSEMRRFLAMSSVQGASVVRKNLDMDQLRDSSVSIPNVEMQRAIATALNALEQELELLGEQCAALKAQKRGLMQKLLTGQWRLPVQEEGN